MQSPFSPPFTRQCSRSSAQEFRNVSINVAQEVRVPPETPRAASALKFLCNSFTTAVAPMLTGGEEHGCKLPASIFLPLVHLVLGDL